MNLVERYGHVSQSQLSVARHYGAAKVNGSTYTYDPATDQLIRDDIFKAERKAAKKPKKEKSVKMPPVSLACKKRGCKGSIEVADEGEIYDGTDGKCDSCGRVYVATQFPDEILMIYDRSRTEGARPKTMSKKTTPSHAER